MQHSLIFSPPNSRRAVAWQEALAAAKLPPAQVFSYEALYEAGSAAELLDDLAWQPTANTWVRMESPVHTSRDVRFLCHIGAKQQGLSQHAWMQGRALIRQPGIMLAGIEYLAQRLEALPFQWLNHPNAVPLTCHKTRCNQHLQAQGVPIPKMQANIRSFSALMAHIDAHQWATTFVKPASGSTGTGVIELQWDGEQLTAITAMEPVTLRSGEQSFRSHIGLRRYDDQALIEAMVTHLIAGDDLQVEQAMAKPYINADECCDLRIITIGGKACHRMARVSQGPITNLHLGNRRCAPEDVLTEQQLTRSLELAEMAAAAFPDCLYLGVDVIPPNGEHEGCVLEVNIFGDLINEALFAGRNPWEHELHVLQNK